jgi:hypothetical protein
MADYSRSDPLSFESALQAYQKKMGITLAQHPIAVDLQSRQSIEEITTLLQGRAQAVGDFRGGVGVMNAIKTTVTVLTPLSGATSLTVAVRQKALMACLISLTLFSGIIPTCQSKASRSRYIVGCMCRLQVDL